jgi:hypothetical protein
VLLSSFSADKTSHLQLPGTVPTCVQPLQQLSSFVRFVTGLIFNLQHLRGEKQGKTERRSRYRKDITVQVSTLCSVVFCSIVLLATYRIYITGSHPYCLHRQASLIHRRSQQLLPIPSSFGNCFCYRTLPIRTDRLANPPYLALPPYHSLLLPPRPQTTDHKTQTSTARYLNATATGYDTP